MYTFQNGNRTCNNLTNFASAVTCRIQFCFQKYDTLLLVCQVNMNAGRVDIDETSLSIPVTIYSTVQISCPPCSMTLSLVNPSGLMVSKCSLTFRDSDAPMTRQSVNIRAVPTLGSNSRLTRLEFLPVSTYFSGSGWDDYSMRPIPVCILYTSLQCSPGPSSNPVIFGIDYGIGN